jgi:predicted polyphosphate/ATP-dependent NAD kinase
MKHIGLIINPVAGMGGAVGLKGTDGDMYDKAVELGASPVTPERARDMLDHITQKDQIQFLVGSGDMGENILKDYSFPYQVADGKSENERTNAEDTIRICKHMVEEGAELIVFVGGDGTARDIYDAIGLDYPVVAVPSGVKIFSGVFAVSAAAAAKLIDMFIEGGSFVEEEVLDIDEDAYRDNKLQARLYGYLRVPKEMNYIQHSKSASSQAASEIENKVETAEWVIEKIEPGVLYLLGPGTTIQAVTDSLNLEKTLLGVDAFYGGKIIQKDLNENQILKVLEQYPKRKIVITPIGGNGFIFGRGNKQFTPRVLREVGLKNILIVSTKEKLGNLQNLRVDTGDKELDDQLHGYREVINGYRESRMVRVL